MDKDILDYWRATYASGIAGWTTHDDTLKKVAINHLYYLAHRQAVTYAKKSNLRDEYSDVNKLKKHLGIYEGS